MGLNSSLSSPTSEQVCKKGGGGKVDSDGSSPVNRTSRSTQASRRSFHYLHHEFTQVPSNLPADQAVVIQLLSIR